MIIRMKTVSALYAGQRGRAACSGILAYTSGMKIFVIQAGVLWRGADHAELNRERWPILQRECVIRKDGCNACPL